MKKYLDIAVKAAFLAGKFLRESQDKVIHVKENRLKDLKLEVDFKSDEIIIDIIKNETPWDILTEEHGCVRRGEDATEYTWIVDPLDGSVNYFSGLPISCVSIALWRGVIPVIGVVHDFNRGVTYSAMEGTGLFLDGHVIVADRAHCIESSILCTGIPSGVKFDKEYQDVFKNGVESYRKVRLLGSAALSLAYVATGKATMYRENGIKIWDVAAGLALVRMSGMDYSCIGYPADVSTDVWAGLKG